MRQKCVIGKNWFTFFNVKVTVRAYGYFCYLFYTAGPLATKLDLIVQHHRPECPVENGITVQDQGHSVWSMGVSMLCSVYPSAETGC